MCFMILDLHKMHFKQISIENKVCNYYESLINAIKLKIKNIIMDEKKIQELDNLFC